jgi:amino acid adenylation domain-containing protein
VVLPTLTLSIPLIDLQACGESERDGEVLRRSTAEASRPFDLSRGPLLRATLLRVADEEHILLLTMHHIISDGWSMGVFFRELAALYTAFSAGRPSPLPELPIQYADFSQWQRQWLQGDVLDQQLKYWTEKLKDIVNLDLPVDQVRPRLQTHRGAHQSVMLKTTCSEGLKNLSRQEGVTMFMTLLAAFKALLHRYSGQDDIVVGCPIANRNRAEIEGLIGFFVNTLVLRTDLSGNPTFVELLERVRETALGAYAHQDLPFEKLLEKLQPERDTSRSPLVQVLFNFLNFTETRLALGDLSLNRLKVGDGETAKFDLTFYVEEAKSGLTVTANYNTDLFDAATISRLLGHFQALLEEIVRTPTQRLSAIPLAVPVEQQRLATAKQRVGPANPFTVFPKAEIEQSIPDRFVKQVKQYPQNIAVKTRQGTWSYDALNKWTNRVARALLAVCRNREERIALLFDHDATMIAGLLAVLKAGKTYTPLDPSYPKERLIYMLDELQAEVILTDGKNVALAKDLQQDARCLVNVEDIPANVKADDPAVSIPPDSLAYILYTSGSTGRPKGVMQTHRNVLHHMRSYTNSLHICENDRLTLISSYGFDAAVMDIFGALLNGATIYPVDVREHGVGELARWLRNERISIYHSTPTVYRYVFGSLSADESLADLRMVVLGGEEVNKRDVDLYKARFSSACLLVNGLGPTESTLALQYFIDKQTEITRLSVPVGFPVEETDILLLDGAGKPAPVIGEIAIRSPYIAQGYWRRPDLTQAVFRSDPQTESMRIYHTGDMGRMRSDGSIEFVGRKDHQVKIRGFRIELGEIETVLVQHPAVRETAVVQREDRIGDKRLVAYIVPSQNHSSTPIELRAFLKAQLPDYMIPSAFIFLDSLPLTPNGKLDRAAFPAPGPSRPDMAETYLPPRTSVEEKLAAIWRDILKLERVGIHDDFFALGGHSLLATQVISRVTDAFEVELPLRSLFETPTVAGLAARVAQGPARKAVPEEITGMLADLEALSDEEAEHLLGQESPK